MATPFTRRGLVAAAPVAVAAASLPALAAVGDAPLLDLGRRLASLNALAAEADRRLDAVSKIYDRATPNETPEALIVRPDDKLTTPTRPEWRGGKPTGRLEYVVDIDRIQQQLASWAKYELDEIRQVDPYIAAVLVRLREIVDSAVLLRDAQRAAWDAAGMPEAENAACEAHGRCVEVMNEIAWCRATTLAGVMLKVRTAIQCFGDTLNEAEAEIDDDLDGLSSAESLALSIVKDLARIAPQSTVGSAHA